MGALELHCGSHLGSVIQDTVEMVSAGQGEEGVSADGEKWW